MHINPGVLLIVCLFSVYLAAMLIFCSCVQRQKREVPLDTEGVLALRAGQTILGVGDTPQGIEFYIDAYVRDEKYYNR
jgi:hypothetical protein